MSAGDVIATRWLARRVAETHAAHPYVSELGMSAVVALAAGDWVQAEAHLAEAARVSPWYRPVLDGLRALCDAHIAAASDAECMRDDEADRWEAAQLDRLERRRDGDA